MFENLSSRLTTTLNALRGAGRLTEDQVKQASRELRMALLEADVALPVVREFIAKVRERAVGSEISGSMAPGQALLKIVQEELVAALGGHGVRAGREDLGNTGGLEAGLGAAERGAQARTAGAHDDDVELVVDEFVGGHAQ